MYQVRLRQTDHHSWAHEATSTVRRNSSFGNDCHPWFVGGPAIVSYMSKCHFKSHLPSAYKEFNQCVNGFIGKARSYKASMGR